MLTLARLGLGLACAAVVIFSSSTEPAAQGPGDDPYVKIRVPLQLKKMITPNKAFVSCNLLRQDNKSAGSATKSVVIENGELDQVVELNIKSTMANLAETKSYECKFQARGYVGASTDPGATGAGPLEESKTGRVLSRQGQRTTRG